MEEQIKQIKKKKRKIKSSYSIRKKLNHGIFFQIFPKLISSCKKIHPSPSSSSVILLFGPQIYKSAREKKLKIGKQYYRK